MERITRKHLEHKVKYLAKLGVVVTLDHHQPGDAKFTWAIEDETGAKRIGWSGRLTARECLIALCMLITGVDGSWK